MSETNGVMRAGRPALQRFALALVAASLVLYLRAPDRVAHPQLWAEDAAVFYIEAEVERWESLAIPYAGYLHAFPRLVAYAGTAIPVRHVPGFYVLGALGATWLVVALALWATGTNDRAPLTAPLFGFVFVTVPFAPEVWLVLTNTQWILAAALILVLGARTPSSTGGRAALAAVVVLASLTGPFGLILLPCAVVRFLWMRDRWSLAIMMIVGTAAIVCGFTMIAFPRGGGPTAMASILDAMTARPLLSAAAILASAGLLVGVVVGRARGDLLLVVCGLSGLLMLLAAAAGAPEEVIVAFPRAGGRYAFLPWLTTAWTLILLVRTSALAVAVVVPAATVSAFNFVLPARVDHDWNKAAACLETTAVCPVTVNPGWHLQLPGRSTNPCLDRHPRGASIVSVRHRPGAS